MKLVLFAFVLLATPAFAQVAPEYAPPDQELWTQMSQAFSGLNMPLTTHQQVQQIMQNVEREAAARAARNKAAGEAAKANPANPPK